MANSIETTTSDSGPAILALMKIGAKIEFKGGYYMQGLPSDKDIQVGNQFGSEGTWSMDVEGVRNALGDMVKMAENDGFDLDGNELPGGPRI